MELRVRWRGLWALGEGEQNMGVSWGFLLTRATHHNAHPLHPKALAFVSYGIVLVRVRVQTELGR